MTPDELITRMFKLQAELHAIETAQAALMIALPELQQEQWHQALRTVQATQAATISTPGGASTGAQSHMRALQRHIEFLEHARKSFVKST